MYCCLKSMTDVTAKVNNLPDLLIGQDIFGYCWILLFSGGLTDSTNQDCCSRRVLPRVQMNIAALVKFTALPDLLIWF